MKAKFLPAVLISSLFIFSSCASEITSSSSETDGEYAGDTLEGGDVTEVTIDDNGEATVEFGDVSDSAEYVLVVQNYDDNGADASLELASLNGYEDKSDSADDKEVNVVVDNEESETEGLENNITEDFHNMLRDEEAGIEVNPENAINEIRSVSGSSRANLSLGTERSIYVLSSFGSNPTYTSVPCVLVRASDDTYVWVEKAYKDSITASEIESFMGPFDAQLDAERARFGNEPDVDNDGHINLVMTSVVNQLGASQGGIVTGFFYGKNELPKSAFTYSAEGEYLFTFLAGDNIPGVKVSKEFALSNLWGPVVAHEFQHMALFNYRYFIRRSPLEMSFLNEGLSHLAENYVGGLENYSRLALYLATPETNFTIKTDLPGRGGITAFLDYLYGQAEAGNNATICPTTDSENLAQSGDEFIKRLGDSEETGIPNIIHAFCGSDVEVSPAVFKRFLKYFSQALLKANTDLSDGNLTEMNFFNLHEEVNDNRGTVLRGPAVRSISSLPANQTLGGTSITFIKITADDINQAGGGFRMQLTDGGDGAGAYVVQTAY